MNKQNRNTRVFGWTVAAALLVFFAAGPLRAIGPDERGERRQATQERQIRAMDAFALTYGDADWSIVAMAIAAHPGDAANPKAMSVFLSLGNVSLTRFEEFRAAADLDRALSY